MDGAASGVLRRDCAAPERGGLEAMYRSAFIRLSLEYACPALIILAVSVVMLFRMHGEDGLNEAARWLLFVVVPLCTMLWFPLYRSFHRQYARLAEVPDLVYSIGEQGMIEWDDKVCRRVYVSRLVRVLGVCPWLIFIVLHVVSFLRFMAGRGFLEGWIVFTGICSMIAIAALHWFYKIWSERKLYRTYKDTIDRVMAGDTPDDPRF